VCMLIIRIPCIFNVLKANQLFPFSISLSHTLSLRFHLHEKKKLFGTRAE
jgi:hypothetical protein